jgi:hypothetical protein
MLVIVSMIPVDQVESLNDADRTSICAIRHAVTHRQVNTFVVCLCPCLVQQRRMWTHLGRVLPMNSTEKWSIFDRHVMVHERNHVDA